VTKPTYEKLTYIEALMKPLSALMVPIKAVFDVLETRLPCICPVDISRFFSQMHPLLTIASSSTRALQTLAVLR
jgi:hypothetical protein